MSELMHFASDGAKLNVIMIITWAEFEVIYVSINTKTQNESTLLHHVTIG